MSTKTVSKNIIPISLNNFCTNIRVFKMKEIKYIFICAREKNYGRKS